MMSAWLTLSSTSRMCMPSALAPQSKRLVDRPRFGGRWCRQREDKLRAAQLRLLHPDAAASLVDDALDEREAEAAPLAHAFAQGNERLEEARGVLGRDPAPAVAPREAHEPGHGIRAGALDAED